MNKTIKVWGMIAWCAGSICGAEVKRELPDRLRLPEVIADNMVLQRGQRVPIWGWAKPGEAVRVEFGGQKVSTLVKPDGTWELKLKALQASATPAQLVVTAGDSITLTNILVGEVWLASGQSNMEKPLGLQPGQKPCENVEAELAAAHYPQIRLFKVEKGAMSKTPLPGLRKFRSWQECSSNALEGGSFSAVGYFFAREIHTNLNVPVGIIASSWGGTRIEPWTAPEGFAAVKSVAEFGRAQPGTNEITKVRPQEIYNTMIHPLVPFAIRGALWYQGESNCIAETNRLIYADKMEALIKGWRKVWSQGDFPFYYVQLAPYRYAARKQTPPISPDALPLTWAAQARALRIRNTGMAVIHDTVTDLGDIHPVRKREVGQRLAGLALHQTYGRVDWVSSGPTVGRVRYSGGAALVRFDHCAGGLVTADGKVPDWFEVAAADGKFIRAEALIDGDAVRCWSPAVPQPVAVRLGWSETAQPNLRNSAGLPVTPFRSP
jgi:sialate O-acetylesterase